MEPGVLELPSHLEHLLWRKVPLDGVGNGHLRLTRHEAAGNLHCERMH